MINRLPAKRSAGPGLVIVPARNEAESVGDVVRDVKRHMDWNVVVVDDASEDTTGMEAAKAGGYVLRMPFQLGAWGAVQVGMAYALGNGYEICVTMDADGQHTADALPSICDPVRRGLSDVGIGICPERVSRARHAACAVFKRISGLNIQDVTSGLRAYNIDAMRLLTNRHASMLNYQDFGVLLMLRNAEMRVAEVNVQMKKRQNGHSRIFDSWWTVSQYLVETAILCAGKWRLPWRCDHSFIVSEPTEDKA